ncbi:CHAT domain-containing protein [Streptomyces sp. NPDC004609]|uniref:CHAT domain-containing protein n=1 Tax=Streptomyces sp. NPDC004609 TaxID=3364704 RepID=UPI0036CD8868
MDQRERTITIRVERLGPGRAVLRYDYGPGTEPGTAPVELSSIEDMLARAETDYYAPLPADPGEARALLESYGTRLFTFLDTPERRLSGFIGRTRGSWDVLALVIGTGAGFGHLPWELLHDGEAFLVAAANPVVPVRQVDGAAGVRSPQSRPLRLAFMACAPESAGGALDHDAEQATIWEATRRFRIELEVEESGELEQLRHRVLEYSRGDVDVVHLTGHAVLAEDGPRFLAEGPHGEAVSATAEDIHDGLGRSPYVVFLSGCRTAESPESGAVASLAESLARSSAPLVLGWGRPVPDSAATGAAAAFYQQLAEGLSPAVALAGTYRRLVRDSVPYWHLLRMFVRGGLPGPLVTPARAPGRDRVIRRSRSGFAGEPLDPRRFVGRRREIQRALRLLDFWDLEQPSAGLIVHGMGGVGKTTLAQRIRERLVDGDRHTLWLHGHLDEGSLLSAIQDDPRLAPALGDPTPGRPLRRQLLSFLDRAPNLLIVLDEFEFNFRKDRLTPDDLQLVDGRPVTLPEAAAVLADLVDAVRASVTVHRIVITSRYLPALDCVRHLERMELHPLLEPELDRLVDRLQQQAPLPPPVVGWARRLAGQNPRLLEWLFNVARSDMDGDIDEQALRARLRDKRGEFLEKNIFAPMLMDRIDSAARDLLKAAAPYLLPVPVGTLARLTGTDPGETERRAHELAGLSLLERTPVEGGGTRFRVPLMLDPLFALTDPRERRRRAARCARRLAEELGDFLEEADARLLDHGILREVHRLAVEGELPELAVDTAISLAEVEFNWMRFGRSAAICREMLQHARVHRLFLQLANAESELGHPTDADLYYERALELCPPDNPRDRAAILSYSAAEAGRRAPERCHAQVTEAIALSRLHGRDSTLADALRTLARYWAGHGGAGERARIAGLFTEAMAAAGKVKDRGVAVAGVRYDRALVQYLREDDLDTARSEMRAVLEDFKRLDLPLHQSMALQELAAVWLNQRPPDTDEATRLVREAIRLNQRLRSVRVEASCEFTLGDIASVREDYETAKEHYAVARDVSRAMGDQLLELTSVMRLFHLHSYLDDAEEAGRHRLAADALTKTFDLPDHRIELLLASVERDRQDPGHDMTAVLEGAGQAASLARETGMPAAEIRAWTVFADEVESAQAPVPEAVPALERLLELHRAAEDAAGVATALRRLGEQLLAVERFQEARAPLTEAMALTEPGDPYPRAKLHDLLATAAEGTGDPRTAEDHLRRCALQWLELEENPGATLALRRLAAVQRSLGSDSARWTLLAARSLCRLVPSGYTESLILEDLAGLEESEGAAWNAWSWREAGQRALHRGTVLRIQMADDIIDHFDPDKGSTSLIQVERLRGELLAAEQWRLPSVNIQDATGFEPGRFSLSVWGEVVHTTTLIVPDDPAADPIDQVAADLRAVAHRYRERIDAGEPHPEPEPGIEDIPVRDILEALRRPDAET